MKHHSVFRFTCLLPECFSILRRMWVTNPLGDLHYRPPLTLQALSGHKIQTELSIFGCCTTCQTIYSSGLWYVMLAHGTALGLGSMESLAEDGCIVPFETIIQSINYSRAIRNLQRVSGFKLSCWRCTVLVMRLLVEHSGFLCDTQNSLHSGSAVEVSVWVKYNVKPLN